MPLPLRAWLLFALCSACQVYDASLTSTLPASDASANDAAEPPPPDTGVPCIATVEQCNGRDDDCDGVVDELRAAQADCDQRVAHAVSTCQSGYCVRLMCLQGWYNCDGIPDNGCESSCECARCIEDDGGAQR